MTTDPETLKKVIDEMPLEYRERYADVAQGPLPTVDEVRDQLETYVRMVRAVSALVTALDPDLADKIATTCMRMLERYGDSDESDLVVAMTAYFIEEDEDHEITGVLGFDDDVQVVNAVCRALDATDLIIAPPGR